MEISELKRLLAGLPIPEVRFFDSIGSTNDEALAWIETGAADGALVVAEHQTRGRGRLDRAWVTRPGAALAFSLILHPTLEEAGHTGLFSPLAGLAVCSALQDLGLPAEIKWPNDVLLARRKTCGILAESSWQGSRLEGVVVGIGINVAPESIPPAEELNFPATCVEDHLVRPVDRGLLLRQVLSEFFNWRRLLGQPQFFEVWEERLAFKGENVRLASPGIDPVYGTLLGVDSEGNLRIRMSQGDVKIGMVGDVHLRPGDAGDETGR